MSEVKKNTPDFYLTVKVNRRSDEMVTLGLRELDEATYIMAAKMIDNGKTLEAVRAIINNLCVEGDSKKVTSPENFQAARAAIRPILELIEPLDGELKKN